MISGNPAVRCFISVALLPFEPNDIVEELVVESRGVIGLEDSASFSRGAQSQCDQAYFAVELGAIFGVEPAFQRRGGPLMSPGGGDGGHLLESSALGDGLVDAAHQAIQGGGIWLGNILTGHGRLSSLEFRLSESSTS